MGGGMGMAPPAQNPFAMNAFGSGQPAQMHPAASATSPFGQNPFGQPATNMATLNAQVQQLNMNQTTNPFGQPAQNNMMPNMVRAFWDVGKILGIFSHRGKILKSFPTVGKF